MSEIPTLLWRWKVNPDLCKLVGGNLHLRMPSGACAIVDGYHHNEPELIKGVLQDWLTAHVEVAIRTVESRKDEG